MTTYPVLIGHLDVTPAVEMAASGDNKLNRIREKLLELVTADESVEPDEAEVLTDAVAVAFQQAALWVPEVAQWRLKHLFVSACPVCGLDLLSTSENNLMVVDKFRDGPLEGKGRYVSCLVCDLVLQPLRVIQYLVKTSKKAAKNGEAGDELKGVAIQGLEPCGTLVPDLTDAGIIVRLLPPDRVALFSKMWEVSAGIIEGYHQRRDTMVQYWDQQDDLKKPKPRPKILLAGGTRSLQ